MGTGQRFLSALVLGAATLSVLAAPASAAAPEIFSSAVTEVSATAATLRAQINPNGFSTTFRSAYITEAAYQANLNAIPPRDGFSGAVLAPVKGVGSGSVSVPVFQQLSGLTPTTIYHYRLVATNSAGSTPGPDRRFGTEEPTNVVRVLDGRGWEMVSPVDKNGGAVQGPGEIFGGGVFRAAAGGGSLTYSSADSFGAGAQGAPAGSQYLATRGGAGWASENITTPLLSGSYGDNPEGVPYQLFSSDLSRALLSNGERCRGMAGGECPVANPPLPGSGAPSGYRDYYRRDGGGFESLLSASDLAQSALEAEQFELRLVAATADLAHVFLSSCAALTADATEVAAAGGCDPTAQNLYEWSGAGLTLINLLPGDDVGAPGAALAAQSGAVSTDGNRAYFAALGDGALYLRETGGPTKLLPETAGGGAVFQIASADGRFAFFTKAGHLYRYDAASQATADLTPGGEVEGVLGASADGSHVYYLTASGLFLWNGGALTKVAAAAAPGDYPPATGTARVSADGSHLLFVSAAELTGYDNRGKAEVFLYGPPPGAGEPRVACVSCNPTGELPEGPSGIPGALANGSGAGAIASYKPRSLSEKGDKAFFESADDLVAQDTNKQVDVYEWEATGSGDCARVPGCVGLISSGRSPESSTFVDASADGSDVFFLTAESLFPTDPGSYDIYDSRVGGGFPPPPNSIPCEGDACQHLPEAPEDPTPGTLVPNTGNPPLRVDGAKPGKGHGHGKRHKKKRPHRGRKR